MSQPSRSRHLSRSALEEYLTLSAPAVIIVPGEPVCRVIIDPLRRQMALRTQARGSELDVSDFEYVHTRLVSADGLAWREVVIEYGEHGHEAYLLLGDVADMIQQNGVALEVAVRAALTTFEGLLARAGRLGAERQTGLYGELLFLECCLRIMPADEAIQAWKGCGQHEHDFVLPNVCFEIKSTRTEKRRHRIGGLDQLEPLPSVPLWLISVQITAATPQTGRTLGEVVDDVRAAAGSSLPALDSALAQSGWRERDRALYRDALTLRSIPTAYPVDGTFPALNQRMVDQSTARPELIVDVSYTIDVTSLLNRVPPIPADRFVEGSR